MTTPTSKSLDTQSLPDSTGIYFFRGRDERPVYIGKSINIRKRVLSHIYDAKTDLKERKIINATQSITYEETPSELSALLLESMRIKQLNPLFNRRLRKTQKVYTWHLKTKQDTQTGEALLIPYLGEAPWPPNPIKDNFGSDTFGTDTFGWYRSKTHAEKHLCTLADKHQLCKKILGLEKTKRGCFGYQLKKCPGTCLKLEPIAEYNKRLEKAIEHHIIKAWPYSGTIGVIEHSNPDTLNIIENWQLIGTAPKHSPNNISLFEQALLDRDAYKIIAGYLFNPNKQVDIFDLSSINQESLNSYQKRLQKKIMAKKSLRQ